MPPADGPSLPCPDSWAHLLVLTVVDAAGFLPELTSGDELAERGLDQYEDDERTVSDLLTELLSRLSPAARIVPAVHGRVPAGEVLGARLFDMERAQQARGRVMERQTARNSSSSARIWVRAHCTRH